MAWQVSNETDDLGMSNPIKVKKIFISDAIESQMRSAVDLSTHSVGDLVDAHSMFQTHRRLRSDISIFSDDVDFNIQIFCLSLPSLFQVVSDHEFDGSLCTNIVLDFD